MTRTLISVCMPCYNAAAYLRAALDSVLAQTYPNVEIVCVDDGSTDETPDILAGYATQHDVRVFTQTNQGQCAAANRAFRESTGQWIKFFDADDLLSSDMLELQAARLAGNPRAIASAMWGRFYREPDEARFEPESVWRDMDPLDWLVESMTGRRNMMQCGLWLIPRTVLDKSGLWNERLSLVNDLEFFPRVLLAAERVLFTKGKVYYRSGLPGSLSGRKSRDAYASAAAAAMGASDTILQAENSERTRQVCADLLQSFNLEIKPHEPELAKSLAGRVAELGGSEVQPSGGPVFHAISRVLGWDRAARLRALAIRRGYASLRTFLSSSRRSTADGR